MPTHQHAYTPIKKRRTHHRMAKVQINYYLSIFVWPFKCQWASYCSFNSKCAIFSTNCYHFKIKLQYQFNIAKCVKQNKRKVTNLPAVLFFRCQPELRRIKTASIFGFEFVRQIA